MRIGLSLTFKEELLYSKSYTILFRTAKIENTECLITSIPKVNNEENKEEMKEKHI